MAKKTEDQLPIERTDLIKKAVDEELKYMKDEQGKYLPEYAAHVIRHVCQLSSFGHGPVRISNQIGIPTRNIKLILRSISVQREIRRLQQELQNKSSEWFMNLLPDAINTTYKIMKSKTTKDSSRIEAAKVIMDRALGRPTQIVEQTTTLLKDVLTSIQAGGNPETQAIEDAQVILPSVNEKEKVETPQDEKKDPLDELLSE